MGFPILIRWHIYAEIAPRFEPLGVESLTKRVVICGLFREIKKGLNAGMFWTRSHFDGLVQERRNSNALASIWTRHLVDGSPECNFGTSASALETFQSNVFQDWSKL